MTRAIRQKARIQSGGLLEIRSSELPEGVDVDVIVLLEDDSVSPVSLSKLRGAAKGCYRSAQEINEFICQERDQWD